MAGQMGEEPEMVPGDSAEPPAATLLEHHKTLLMSRDRGWWVQGLLTDPSFGMSSGLWRLPIRYPRCDQLVKVREHHCRPCSAAPLSLVLSTSLGFIFVPSTSGSLATWVCLPSPAFLSKDAPIPDSRHVCPPGSHQHSHLLHPARAWFWQYWIKQRSSTWSRLQFWFVCHFKIRSFFSPLHSLVLIEHLDTESFLKVLKK